MIKIERVGILGGSGFVGHSVVRRLAERGLKTRILTRHPQRHRDLSLTNGAELLQTDVFHPGALAAGLADCQAAINLVGILNESGSNATFQKIHVELPGLVVDACQHNGIDRLLHMSALHADPDKGSSAYLRSKGEAEAQIHSRCEQLGIHVTSFRPSVIFGPDDSFINRFAGLLRFAAGIFPLACPQARFAPVFVEDVAEAFARAIGDPVTFGQQYELCGPRVFSLKELVEYTARLLGKRIHILGLGDGMARLQARVLGAMPGKPFSMDNYLSLQTDSICGSDGLEQLGIDPTDIDTVVPLYLAGESQRTRYQQLRRAV